MKTGEYRIQKTIRVLPDLWDKATDAAWKDKRPLREWLEKAIQEKIERIAKSP